MHYEATVENIIAPSENIRVINLNCAQKLDYQAGQYLRAAVGDMTGSFIRLQARRIVMLLNCILKRCRTEQPVYCRSVKGRRYGHDEGVHGDMTFGSDAAKPVIMIAGGLGIAPMKAMVEQIVHEKARSGYSSLLGRLFPKSFICVCSLNSFQ